METSTIIFQGMLEEDVIDAGRSFERVARQMVAAVADNVRLCLIAPLSAPVYQPITSMDRKESISAALYRLPEIEYGGNISTLAVSQPTLLGTPHHCDEALMGRFAKIMRRLDRHNRKTMLDGLEKALSSLNLTQQEVQMRVDFGEFALITYPRPTSGEHHSLDSFRRALAKDRTLLLLKMYATSPIQLSKVIN